MLCDSEISNFNALISPSSAIDIKYVPKNGNLKTCRNDDIKTYSRVVAYDKCEIYWSDQSNGTDKVTSYLLRYLEINNFEKSEFDENMLFERDICSNVGWKNLILKQENYTLQRTKDQNRMTMVHTLKNLKQYTIYAFTIQPYDYNTSDFMTSEDNFTMSGSSEVNTFKYVYIIYNFKGINLI